MAAKRMSIISMDHAVYAEVFVAVLRYAYVCSSMFLFLCLFAVAGVARAMNRVNIGSGGPGPSAGCGRLIVSCDLYEYYTEK